MLNMNVFMLCFRTDSVGVQAVISTCLSPIAWRRYKSDTCEFCNEQVDCSGWMTAALMCLISALTAAVSWSSASSSASQCWENSSSRTTCLRSASREYCTNTHFNMTGFMDMLNALPCCGLGHICFIAVNWRNWSDTLNPREALTRNRKMRRSCSVMRRIISWSPLLASRPSTWRWVSVQTKSSDHINSSSLLCFHIYFTGTELF